MSELKLVIGADGEPEAAPPKPEASTLNPLDALNRRDIELIKKSLTSMHKDSADLRSTIVALHARNSGVPSRGFFLSMGVVGFVAVAILVAARPTLDAAFHHVPVLAGLSTADINR